MNSNQKQIEKILFDKTHIKHIEVLKRMSKTMTTQEILDEIGII